MTRRVVLLGGGYVTLHAYQQLARRLRRAVRRGEVEIVVISADDAHSFHGFTGEVLAGILPFERTRTPLAQACPLATVIHGRATAVDPRARTVTYTDAADGRGHTLGYAELVVGTGGREPVTSIPGLAEHGFTLRAPGDIRRLRDHLLAEEDDDHLGARRVVVAGGGLAGVELAAAIADFGRGRVAVSLVHSGPRVLPGLRAGYPLLADHAERELRRLDVAVTTGSRLVGVSPEGAHLADGRFLPASTVLATVGQLPVRLPGLDPGWHDERGRLVTAPDLSVADGVWAAGDTARVAHPRTGEPVPANALWAIKAGGHAGHSVARALLGQPGRPFRYGGLGQAASFGMGRSVAELYGLQFTGGLAWVLRLAFFLRFMPSRRHAGQVLLDLGAIGWSTLRPGPAGPGRTLEVSLQRSRPLHHKGLGEVRQWHARKQPRVDSVSAAVPLPRGQAV